MSKKNLSIALALTVAVSALLGLQAVNGRLSDIRGGDAAHYVLLAKAIATGYGYSDSFIPGNPAHTQYPPIFPLILSTIYYLFGLNLVWMKLAVVASGAASVYMTKKVFEKDGGEALGILIALLTATNFYFVFYMKELMTEVPFIFISLCAVYASELFVKDPASVRKSITACALVAAAYMTRMMGVAIYAAAVTALSLGALREQRQRQGVIKDIALFAVIAITPFVLWNVRASLVSTGVSTYGSIFMQADYYSADKGTIGAAALLGRIWENAGYYIDSAPSMLLTFTGVKAYLPAAAYRALSLLFLSLMLTGFIMGLISKKGVKDLYFLYYSAILMVWQVYGEGDAGRYTVALIPFIYGYTISGAVLIVGAIAALSGKRDTGARRLKISLAPVLILLIMNVLQMRQYLYPPAAASSIAASVRHIATNLTSRVEGIDPYAAGSDYFSKSEPCYSHYMNYAFYLREMDRDSVVLTRKPEITALITGARAVRFPYTKDQGRMQAIIDTMGVRYVIVDECYPETRVSLTPFIEAHPEEFRKIAVNSKGAGIYEYTGRNRGR